MDTAHEGAVGGRAGAGRFISPASIHQTGLVHRHVRARHLSSKSVHRVPDAENRSGTRSGR